MIRNDVVNTLEFPVPTFHLGQQVECEFQARGQQQCRRGTVIGLEYIPFEYALKADEGVFGWCYTISSMVGVSEAAWLQVRDPYDVHWNCIEPEMTAVAVAVACKTLPSTLEEVA